MPSVGNVAFVMVRTTFVMGVVKQVNIPWSTLSDQEKDRVPPRLKTTLRGTIEFVKVEQRTTGAKAVDITWFANDKFSTTNMTNIRILGFQNIPLASFDQATNIAWGDAQALDIPHRDEDNTGEFHVRIDCGAGNSRPGAMTFAFLPETAVGAG